MMLFYISGCKLFLQSNWNRKTCFQVVKKYWWLSENEAFSCLSFLLFLHNLALCQFNPLIFLTFLTVQNIRRFSLYNRHVMPAVTFVYSKSVHLWLKAPIPYLFMVELEFFRHHWDSDSCLASWLLLDHNMTKACVMTFCDICIFICDIKNVSETPQARQSSSINTAKIVPYVPAKWTRLGSLVDNNNIF